METSLGKYVTIYLYKCLLRRRQALQVLRPIDGKIVQFDEAIDLLAGTMDSEEVCDADKQMVITRAKNIEIYVDASAKYHDKPEIPNKVSISFIVQEDDKVIYEKAQYLGSYITIVVQEKPITFDITVNVAEYLALIKALEFLIESEFKGAVTIFSDSQLIVRQVNFTSSARSPKLIILRDYTRRLKDKLPGLQLIHLNREDNSQADKLAKDILSEDEDLE